MYPSSPILYIPSFGGVDKRRNLLLYPKVTANTISATVSKSDYRIERNMLIIRYAEVLLNEAEAAASRDKDLALKKLN